ncbi:MAG TPA: CPBP family intramembrane glutamic endopeptidase [Pseudogracilibacillus sp.]|nr:CPBP family intramembrane glutamic endopeptidase [Pseudogracilibacillus sp.]
MKQADIIKQLSDKELKKQLLFSQSIFLLLAIGLSLFFFNSFFRWFALFQWELDQILMYGVFPALGLVVIELIIYSILPPHLFDDGGINERIFKDQSITWIICICFIVAVSEEALFRGVIQTSFGFIFASSIFALIHVRYLKKPILFIFILVTSFGIGYLYYQTGNILVTMTFHFIVDALLGLVIRFKK